MNMPREKRKEPGEIHPEFWKKTVKEAFKNDPLRIMIELIKNSADSYTRLEKQAKAKPPFEIFVTIYCRSRRPPSIEICDYAEAMDSGKLKEALKYGTPISRGEDIEARTSAEKGIGLKDAMMALTDNWLITIKDNLINERNKHVDFSTGIGKEDETVTEKERNELGILGNGTLVRGKLPDYFRERKFPTIYKHLKDHFLLRKLIQCSEYRIYVVNGWSKEKRLLNYKPPEIEKQILCEKLRIEYEGKKFPIEITINRSEEELRQGKPYGDSGLLFFHGRYSVLDFSLCRFERDPSFSRIFGEVKMGVERLIRDPQESPLVDEKRRGLDTTHPFNIKLLKLVNENLKLIQEQEESSKYTFDEESKRKILQEINKIYKSIKGKGPKPEPPIKPEFFEFHRPYTSITEYEPKTVYLIVNSSIVFGELTIHLRSSNPKILVKPNKVKIDEYKAKENFVMKNIRLYSKEAGNRGEIVAESDSPQYSTKIGVEVLVNPIFSPDNGFAFVPNKTTIVDGGAKKVALCVDKDIITGSKEIDLISQDPIGCPGKWILPDLKNLEERSLKNILKLEIPINVSETGHVGEKAAIVAMYRDKTSNLRISIVHEPSIGGLLRDIRFSEKDTKLISHFIDEEGILEVYRKHPLIKKYMRGKFKNRVDFLVFVADVMTREVVKSFVVGGIKENLSRFPIFDLDHPEPEIDTYVAREYYEHGLRLHEAFMKLVGSLKL